MDFDKNYEAYAIITLKNGNLIRAELVRTYDSKDAAERDLFCYRVVKVSFEKEG